MAQHDCVVLHHKASYLLRRESLSSAGLVNDAGKLACGSYSYMGDWMDDEMHGQGKFVFASGASYHGCFDRNKFHGQGTYVFPDGKQYQVGQELCMAALHRRTALLRCCHVVTQHMQLVLQTFPSKTCWVLRCACLQGQWVANVMHGEGCFTDTEGHQWTGQFFNGAGPGLTCQL